VTFAESIYLRSEGHEGIWVFAGQAEIRERLTELLMAGGGDVWGAVAIGVAEIDSLGPDLPSAVLKSLQSDATSGQSLYIAIRQSIPAEPVIVLGPDIDVETKVTLFELGMDDDMVRPLDSYSQCSYG
jgi:DNA-binding response OmpR family regulator